MGSMAGSGSLILRLRPVSPINSGSGSENCRHIQGRASASGAFKSGASGAMFTLGITLSFIELKEY